MILTATTDRLRIVTEQVGDIDIVVTYIDRVTSTGAVGPANRQTSNHTTVNDNGFLDPPSADTTRKVLSLTIRNAHATTSMDCRVVFDANGTFYELHAARLYPTEMLEYNEAGGFKKLGKETQPFSYNAVSNYIARSNNIVTGSDQNVVMVPGTARIFPKSKSMDLARRVCAFAWVTEIAGAITTGFAIGFLAPDWPFSLTRSGSLSAVTASVTLATKATVALLSGGNGLTANGTSTTAGNLPTIYGAALGFTETEIFNTDLDPVFFGCQSEVGGSLITVGKGSLFQVRENTD